MPDKHPKTDPSSEGGGVMKTLAIRLDDELHAQLSVLAQLSGTSLTDEIRQALEAHLKASATNPELTKRAKARVRGDRARSPGPAGGHRHAVRQPEQPRDAKASSKRPRSSEDDSREQLTLFPRSERPELARALGGSLWSLGRSRAKHQGSRPTTKRTSRKEVSMYEGEPDEDDEERRAIFMANVGDDGGLRGEWMDTAEYIADTEENIALWWRHLRHAARQCGMVRTISNPASCSWAIENRWRSSPRRPAASPSTDKPSSLGRDTSAATRRRCDGFKMLTSAAGRVPSSSSSEVLAELGPTLAEGPGGDQQTRVTR